MPEVSEADNAHRHEQVPSQTDVAREFHQGGSKSRPLGVVRSGGGPPLSTPDPDEAHGPARSGGTELRGNLSSTTRSSTMWRWSTTSSTWYTSRTLSSWPRDLTRSIIDLSPQRRRDRQCEGHWQRLGQAFGERPEGATFDDAASTHLWAVGWHPDCSFRCGNAEHKTAGRRRVEEQTIGRAHHANRGSAAACWHYGGRRSVAKPAAVWRFRARMNRGIGTTFREGRAR
jgi:hypothetical protein